LEIYRSYKALKKALEDKTISCVDIVQHYLQQIQRQKHLNAFLEVFEQGSLERAKVIDEKINSGDAGKLAGMVVGIKDVLCYEGHKVQASSKILNGFESQFTGTAVQRLLDEDAIIIGRLNCDEFAMGSSNENSAFGPVLNAADNTRVPGGSSGGSAVAVQAGLCTVALGSDTGGSVRQPAAFCGVVGIKPTYSRVSRHGLLAYASSFDTIGVFSHTIEDNALVLETIAGKDEWDSTVSQRPVPSYSSKLTTNKPYRIAYIEETFSSPGLNSEIKETLLSTIEELRAKGHQVEPVKFPYLDYLLPTYYILIMAEASSNLSRYDGVRYGYRSIGPKNLEELYKKTRTEGFGEEVKRRIMTGTFILSASYYDAFYTKAQKARRVIKDKTQAILKDYDFMIMPTTPTYQRPIRNVFGRFIYGASFCSRCSGHICP